MYHIGALAASPYPRPFPRQTRDARGRFGTGFFTCFAKPPYSPHKIQSGLRDLTTKSNFAVRAKADDVEDIPADVDADQG